MTRYRYGANTFQKVRLVNAYYANSTGLTRSLSYNSESVATLAVAKENLLANRTTQWDIHFIDRDVAA